MPNPIHNAVRAVAEHAVELIAGWNRKRLPPLEPTTWSVSISRCKPN